MNSNSTQQDNISSKAQPGSHESGTGGETTTRSDSQVDVKDVFFLSLDKKLL